MPSIPGRNPARPTRVGSFRPETFMIGLPSYRVTTNKLIEHMPPELPLHLGRKA